MASSIGMHERADELYDRAIEIYARADDRWGPEGVLMTRGKKAIALLDKGDAKAAVKQLEELVADYPEDNFRGRLEAESALGRGLAELGRFEEAWEAFDRAWTMAEKAELVESMGAGIHFAHGRARELAGEHDEARRLVELAVATLPPPPEGGDDRFAAVREELAAWLKEH